MSYIEEFMHVLPQVYMHINSRDDGLSKIGSIYKINIKYIWYDSFMS